MNGMFAKLDFVCLMTRKSSYVFCLTISKGPYYISMYGSFVWLLNNVNK